MTEKNPTVGLAAHAGQTDVRITAKADTEAEAEALIAPVEAELRERLGVAIYGVGKETVQEVVGRLLAENKIQLGVVDTLTDGQLTRELTEAGFGELITTDLHSVDVQEALKTLHLDSSSGLNEADKSTLAAVLAQNVAPAGGVGLALVGPFSEQSTFIALHGPGEIRLSELGRNYQDTGYVRRWLVIQGFDWIRRAVLGQMTSPVDWK